MLRRRLLKIIIPMVGLLLVSAIAGIWILEGTLSRLQRLNENQLVISEKANEFANTIRDLRKDVHELMAHNPVQGSDMTRKVDHALQLLAGIEPTVVREWRFKQTLDNITARLQPLKTMIAALADQPETQPREKLDLALAACNEIDVFDSQLNEGVRKQASAEQQSLSDAFRRNVVMLAIASILIINVSIVTLLRMGAMILSPVEKMMEAAREWGQEHFEARLRVESTDEFGQLASAYNHMAEQLQESDQRRMEILRQVALTMNHELNNVINIIQLQVMLVSKRCDDSGELRGYLKQIHESLERMAKVVNSLRNARRIVLTDYMSGMKMLDLQRSMQESDPVEKISPAGQAESGK